MGRSKKYNKRMHEYEEDYFGKQKKSYDCNKELKKIKKEKKNKRKQKKMDDFND